MRFVKEIPNTPAQGNESITKQQLTSNIKNHLSSSSSQKIKPIKDIRLPLSCQTLATKDFLSFPTPNEKEVLQEPLKTSIGICSDQKGNFQEEKKRGSFGDIENKLEYSHSSIASNIIKPIEFFVIAPEIGEGYNLMYSIPEMLKRASIDWKKCKVATEDLRLIQQLGTCRECSEGRPLAIFMPCGHGGSCLRCAIQKNTKQKLCHYCHRVIPIL